MPAIYTDMDGTGGDYPKWKKSGRETQLQYGFTSIWNIRNSMEDIKKKKGKMKGGVGIREEV